ncbi:MAG TPA: glycosyltransferase [Ignavibacteria bacterium]|nr:glycosyltransferase [Ignavibacteria bacterium]
MVTFFIPFYNESSTILDCLTAIINSNEKCEIIAIDDGSTDSSYEKIKHLPIRIIKTKNVGKARALNSATKEANGDVFIFVDADVIISKPLWKIINPFLREYDLININNIIESREVELTKNTFTPPINIICIKKKVFKSLKGFSTIYPKAGGEDLDLLIRLLGKGHKAYILNEDYIHKDKPMIFLKKWRFIIWNNITYIKNIRYKYCQIKLLKNIKSIPAKIMSIFVKL